MPQTLEHDLIHKWGLQMSSSWAEATRGTLMNSDYNDALTPHMGTKLETGTEMMLQGHTDSHSMSWMGTTSLSDSCENRRGQECLRTLESHLSCNWGVNQAGWCTPIVPATRGRGRLRPSLKNEQMKTRTITEVPWNTFPTVGLLKILRTS